MPNKSFQQLAAMPFPPELLPHGAGCASSATLPEAKHYRSKVRALPYPWKLRVLNCKHCDSFRAVLAEWIDANACFRLLPSDFAVRIPVETPGHHCCTRKFTLVVI